MKDWIVCYPEEESCVFELSKDPCECRNLLASPNDHELPANKACALSDYYDLYSKASVECCNRLHDPVSSPALHGGRWVPWSKDCENQGNKEGRKP